VKYLKLYESFNEIESICKKYGIENYTINADGSIDVDGDVNLNRESLKVLPLKFRKVTGDFYCMYNKLTSLEGAPKSVDGNFDCNDNQLTSLEGAPKSVDGNFDCSHNQLTSLEGSPEKVGGNFNCSYNQLTSLEDCPEKVGGSFYCSRNKLTSLEHFPQVIGYINLHANPVNAIWQLFQDKDKIELFNDYDCTRGNEIIIYRLNEFLQSIGKPPVKSVEGYNNI